MKQDLYHVVRFIPFHIMDINGYKDTCKRRTFPIEEIQTLSDHAKLTYQSYIMSYSKSSRKISTYIYEIFFYIHPDIHDTISGSNQHVQISM